MSPSNPADGTSHPAAGFSFVGGDGQKHPQTTMIEVGRVFLASGSPRRRELLAQLGLPFTVQVADVDETPLPGELAEALVMRLARNKAERVAQAAPTDALVVGADTVVVRGRRLHGKPDDGDDASRMLHALAGREHRVVSGVAVTCHGELRVTTCTSRVWLRRFTDQEIADYVASGDPLDKAGAYAVQNERFQPVERLVGCRCNVVGLPLGVVAALLAAAGAPLPVSPESACPYDVFAPARCVLG